MKVIYWLRNDLRLTDNQAFRWLANNAGPNDELLIAYVLPPGHDRWGIEKKRFVEESLAELSNSLKDRFPMYKVSFPSKAFEGQCGLTAFLDLLPPNETYTFLYTADHSFDEAEEEMALRLWSKGKNVTIHSFDQSTILSESELPFAFTDLPKVFTAFRQKVEPLILSMDVPSTDVSAKETFKFPSCKRLDLNSFRSSVDVSIEQVQPRTQVQHSPIEARPKRGFRFHGGHVNAHRRVDEYFFETDSVATYFETRNGMLGRDDSTKFSPWLAVGAVSPREILAKLRQFEIERIKNKSTYWVLFELLWRDFFKFEARRVGARLFHLNGPIGKKPTLCDEIEAKQRFEHWAKAQTEFEFINANIRELLETGWMSNRGRQNVASYLAKNLEVPWTMGADFFERHLVDYDCAVNWGNWNYFAGVGRDPRDRRFNTVTQQNTYDADGLYRKTWQE